MTQQCKLLELSRSSVYYRPVDVSNEDLRLMKAIDEIHLEQPFRGSRRITDALIDRDITSCINRKKVQRLMRQIGYTRFASEKENELTRQGAYNLSLLTERHEDRSTETSLGKGYQLYSGGKRVSLSGCCHGLE